MTELGTIYYLFFLNMENSLKKLSLHWNDGFPFLFFLFLTAFPLWMNHLLKTTKNEEFKKIKYIDELVGNEEILTGKKKEGRKMRISWEIIETKVGFIPVLTLEPRKKNLPWESITSHLDFRPKFNLSVQSNKLQVENLIWY